MIDYNPIQKFQKWFYEADVLYDEREPNALSLTTSGVDGFPKSRMVLLKKYSWEGFTFYTNYNSVKGQSIQHNPNVYLLFNWIKSQRIVTVTGVAHKISNEESQCYFDLRPRASKIGAWASPQSQEIPSRAILEHREKELIRRFEGREIPKPVHWGGYLVKPSIIGFIKKEDGFCFRENYTLNSEMIWKKVDDIYRDEI